MTNDTTRPKSVEMPQRWPAHVVRVTTIVRLDSHQSVSLLLKVDAPRWDGRPLRWDAELDDPQFVRLATAAGCGEYALSLLDGYPVWIRTTRSSGYYHVVEVVPAPAGRSPNGLKWVRLSEAT